MITTTMRHDRQTDGRTIRCSGGEDILTFWRYIQTKLDTSGYANAGALKRDLFLMCDNAVKYNKSKSQVHSDALRLRKVTENYEGPTVSGTAGAGAAAATQQSHQTPKPAARPNARPTATPARTSATKASKQAMNKLVEDMLNLTGEDGYALIPTTVFLVMTDIDFQAVHS